MKRFLMWSVASAGVLFLALGCAQAPEKSQMQDAIDELRMMRQDMAKMGSTDSAEYEIRVALMAFYSYLLKKDAQVPYHIPTVEVVGDTERIKRYSYWTRETYIRDVHYNGDRFDYIEIKDLKLMVYDTDARASYRIVPYQRVSKKVENETRSALRPILVDGKRLELLPPKSPVRLKKLPAEEGEEVMWKVNYEDAIISGFAVAEAEKPGLFARLFGKTDEQTATDEELWKEQKQ